MWRVLTCCKGLMGCSGASTLAGGRGSGRSHFSRRFTQWPQGRRSSHFKTPCQLQVNYRAHCRAPCHTRLTFTLRLLHAKQPFLLLVCGFLARSLSCRPCDPTTAWSPSRKRKRLENFSRSLVRIIQIIGSNQWKRRTCTAPNPEMTKDTAPSLCTSIVHSKLIRSNQALQALLGA